MTKTAYDYRIEDVQRATVNGKAVKLFTASEREGETFVHVGRFSAPGKTADRDLWKIAEDRGGIGYGAR
ncbi:hypothetical protein [Variovorax paradoxus]|uniref:hypothetical protein n=1 Tax=Variovorax paradoxus TaxID=34073 RepID=UPI001ABD3A47